MLSLRIPIQAITNKKTTSDTSFAPSTLNLIELLERMTLTAIRWTREIMNRLSKSLEIWGRDCGRNRHAYDIIRFASIIQSSLKIRQEYSHISMECQAMSGYCSQFARCSLDPNVRIIYNSDSGPLFAIRYNEPVHANVHLTQSDPSIRASDNGSDLFYGRSIVYLIKADDRQSRHPTAGKVARVAAPASIVRLFLRADFLLTKTSTCPTVFSCHYQLPDGNCA